MNVLITGDSGGIGQIVVKKFKKNVNLIYFNQVRIENRKGVNSAVKKIIKKFKHIDAVINIAGILGPHGKFHTQNLAEWENVIKINLIGTANVCHAVLPFMIKQKRGKIINFSGGGASKPFKDFSGYAVSKVAIVRFTENLAWEYQDYNIQVNAIAPGLIKTRMGKRTKMGNKYDNPNLVMDLIAWLLLEENKITGKLIAAQWDKWQAWDSAINKTSDYTLRRIDNKHFYESRHNRVR